MEYAAHGGGGDAANVASVEMLPMWKCCQLPIPVANGDAPCADLSGWGRGLRPRKAWERGLPARDIGYCAGRGGTPHPLAPRARCPRSQEDSCSQAGRRSPDRRATFQPFNFSTFQHPVVAGRMPALPGTNGQCRGRGRRRGRNRRGSRRRLRRRRRGRARPCRSCGPAGSTAPRW